MTDSEKQKVLSQPLQHQPTRTTEWQPQKRSRMLSANLIVDLGNTALSLTSIIGTPVLSGALVAPCSGAIIGTGCNMLIADTYTNLAVQGFSNTSGKLRVQVQCAPADVSGQYTDPTSGLANLPGAWQSGGLLWINSGGDGGLLGAFASGQQATSSGFMLQQAFQRTGQFVRANLLSGDFGAGPLTIGFIGQLRTTGSGGGWSPQPAGSGNTINV